MSIIITMIITFIATGIDEMLILILLFSQARGRNQIQKVYIGQQIGMTVILFVTIVAVYGISFVHGKWTGLLGILPIIIGLMELFEKDEDEESEILLKKTSIFSSLTVRVAIIALAGGAEELAIYIPYFSQLDINGIILAVVTFLLMIPIWCTFCYMVGSIEHIYTFIKRYENLIIPLVFIGIGVKILIESGTIEVILDLVL